MPSPSDRYTRLVGYVGAFANWTIPVATISSMRNDPLLINGKLTGTLALYSMIFVRWSIAISPANWPLFACHVTNASAQLIQLGRYFHAHFKQPKQP